MGELLVDKYLSKLEESDRSELEKIRVTVKNVVPEAVEVISYGMPGFKYKGQYLLGYAAFSDHLSLFPTPYPIEVLKDKLIDYKTSKATIQIHKSSPLPEALITEIVQIRLKSILEKKK